MVHTLVKYRRKETLRFQKYRCFKDTGAVEIKHITVQIGANSSGKSSFLIFPPLLKQSMGEFVNRAFLWTGSMVELKGFNNTVRKYVLVNYMKILFVITRNA